MTVANEMTEPTRRHGKVIVKFTDGDCGYATTGAIRLDVTIATIINRIIHDGRMYDSAFVKRILVDRMIMTVDKHRGSRSIRLDDTLDQLVGVPFIPSGDEVSLPIYVWEKAENDCTRCGICCMFHFEANKYAYGTPISTEKWVGKGQFRCVNLQFDDVTGNYSCAKVGERSMVCERFLCGYIGGRRGHEPGRDPAEFGVSPERPKCRECMASDLIYDGMIVPNETPKDKCNNCRALPHRVEWLIAYARRHELTEKDVEYAKSLHAHLETAYIDGSFKKHLTTIIDKIIGDRVGHRTI